MRFWETLFASGILARGKKYFGEGRVRDLTEVGDGIFSAYVDGTGIYSVTIREKDRFSYDMSCSCPHAASGARCKHMAAVLYAVEARRSTSTEAIHITAAEDPRKKKVIKPFRKPGANDPDGRYSYFDFPRMAGGLSVDEDVFEKALALVDSESYEHPFRTEFGADAYFNSGDACVGLIEVGYLEDTGRVRCSFRFSRDSILSGRCGCQRYNPYGLFRRTDKLCRHQAATLLLLERYIEEFNPGDSTDRNAERLFTAFRRSANASDKGETATPEAVVRLEPRLTRSAGRLLLSFRIGTGKLYVVKKLPVLVDIVRGGESLPLGKAEPLDFSRCAFDEESAPYYSLVRRYVEDERRRLGPYDELNIKSDILLSGSVLDGFYELAQGKTLPFKDDEDSDASECLLTEGDPAVELTVRKDVSVGNVFHGVKVAGSLPEFFDGAEHRYCLEDRRLCRMSEGLLEKLRPLTELAEDGEIGFRVGRRHLSEFYYSVLPELRQRVTIREPDADEIEPYLPPEPTFVFYLDAVERVPRCEATVSYDGTVYSLRDWEKPGFKDTGTRDASREQLVLETVKKYFPITNFKTNECICRREDEAVFETLSVGVPELLRLGEVQSTERFSAMRVRRKVKLTMGVTTQNDLLDIDITSKDVPKEELLALLESYRLKRTFHRLSSGDFVELDDSVAELDELVEELDLSPRELIEGKAHIPAYRALYLDKMLEKNESVEVMRDRRFRALTKDFRTVNDADFEVPTSLRDILRGYQQYGYKWMRTLGAYGFGGILADDMGLGKTLQVITVLLALKEEGQEGTSIVITPASLVFNWAEEFSRFAPALSVCPVAGAQKQRAEIIRDYRAHDVLVTSYDLLKRDIAEYESCEFLYEVIDEAQYIKNHETSAARSVKVINSRARLALTGTPIENRLSELWSIFDYLMPGFLGGYEAFKRELEIPIARKDDEKAKLRLRRLTAPFILRRLKSDVLTELPEKLEEVRYAHFGEEQQKLYDAQILRMKDMLARQGDDGFASGKIRILAELTRLRQICCDPSLLFENYDSGSAKLDACMELIESAVEGEHRILLFSQFTSMLALLERELRARQIEYYTITGSTPKAERLELVRRFNEGDTPVFLISLKAGGTGLNLTGADMVIHYDPWWNVAAQNQATDRAHRIGQEKVVTVYKLIAKGSVEEKIQTLQEKKRALADAVLTGESVSLSGMSREEVLALLDG